MTRAKLIMSIHTFSTWKMGPISKLPFSKLPKQPIWGQALSNVTGVGSGQVRLRRERWRQLLLVVVLLRHQCLLCPCR